MAESLKKKTIKGVIWSFIEKFSLQGVQFLVMLVIARILTPKDFGLIGMLAVFIAISDSLIDSGFTQALIRKQNRSEVDNCTVFYFNIVASAILYLILFFSAPFVADFYNEPILCDLMRVLMTIVVVHSFAIVQRSIYTQNVDFKTLAKASFIAAVISGGIGVLMALKGFGVWSLVGQQISKAVVHTIMLWIYSNWRPRLLYSWQSFRELFSFGSKLMLSGLLVTVFNNIYQIVIGKIYSASSLGFFSQAKNFTAIASSNISSIIQRVTYPVLCKMQDNDVVLGTNYRKLLRLSAFIIFPLMCILAGVAHPLVVILIGEKWSFSAVLLVPMCLASMWYPVHAINLNLLQVKGRSDLFLKLEIIKKFIGITVLVISIPFGLEFMCWCRIASSIIALFINTYYTGKLINVGFLVQMNDLKGTLFASLATLVLIRLAILPFNNLWVQLIVGLFVGGVFYLGVSFLFKFKEWDYIKSIRN